MQLRLLGAIPLGRQLIAVSDRRVDHGGATVRILRDSGISLTGPSALSTSVTTSWLSLRYRAIPRGPLRERLVIGGPTASLLWPSLWLTWQGRARRIRWLSRHWAHDPEPVTAPAPAA